MYTLTVPSFTKKVFSMESTFCIEVLLELGRKGFFISSEIARIMFHKFDSNPGRKKERGLGRRGL